MSGWLVCLVAFYTIFTTEMIHAMHVAPEWEEPALLGQTPHPD